MKHLSFWVSLHYSLTRIFNNEKRKCCFVCNL